MIFQDPLGAFDPRQTVRESMLEALKVHGKLNESSEQLLLELMDTVGLPHSALDVSPRRLSGGQRQRAVIARAISLEPTLIVADEPFAALDVTTQARVVKVMSRLQNERGLTQLVISHDLSLIDLICDEVFVLYLGSIVEQGSAEELAANPAHPYTVALRSAIPVPDPVKQRQRERILLTGDPPAAAARPSGCPFHPRCPIATALCAQTKPELREVRDGHRAACHYAEQVMEHGLKPDLNEEGTE
jgi:peptide/nickel transport system ATP-binding protein